MEAIRNTVDCGKTGTSKPVDPREHSALIFSRACILLMIDEGWNEARMSAALDVSESTAYRVKRR